MNFLKQKKYQLILGLGTAGIIFIFILYFVFSNLVDEFSPAEKVNNADNIGFNITPTEQTAQRAPRNTEEELSQKVAEQQSKKRNVADSRSISFAAMNPNISNGKAVEAHKNTGTPSRAQQNNTATNEAILAEVMGTRPKSSQSTSTKRSSGPAEEEIKEQLNQIYQTSGRPTQSQSSRRDEPKETPEERRKRLMRTGYDALTDNEQQSTRRISNEKPISCLIHGTQTIKVGGILVLRTLEQTKTLDGTIIPPNTLIYGTAKLKENRVLIECNAVKIQGNIYPISYTMYSNDGREGIPVQISASQKTTGDAVSNVAQNQINRMAAANPITAVISNITSEVSNSVRQEKRIEITLIDGQRILLKQKTQKDEIY